MNDFRNEGEGDRWVRASNREWEQKKRQYESQATGCTLSTVGLLVTVGAGLNLYENIAKYSASDIVKTGAVALAGLGVVVLAVYLAERHR